MPNSDHAWQMKQVGKCPHPLNRILVANNSLKKPSSYEPRLMPRLNSSLNILAGDDDSKPGRNICCIQEA